MPHAIIELAEEAEVVAVMPMLEARMVVVEVEVKAGAEPPHGRGRGRYTPYTGYYSADEWQSLSSAQRTRVTEA